MSKTREELEKGWGALMSTQREQLLRAAESILLCFKHNTQPMDFSQVCMNLVVINPYITRGELRERLAVLVMSGKLLLDKNGCYSLMWEEV